MATTNTDQLRRLPWELLERIVERLPVPDIIRLKQVNRGFHDFIRRSSRIQHELDLYATGLKPNWAAGVTIADSIKALGQYRSRWENFDIEAHQTTARIPDGEREATAGGVYGIAMEREIQLFTLPSNSRGIQPTKQRIPLDFEVVGFAFHPQADVIVIAEQAGIMKLHLMTMSGGLLHPSARKKAIEYVTESINFPRGGSLSITGQRLAWMVENRGLKTSQLNVWDWKTGEQLFEHRDSCYQHLEFLDDYQLLVSAAPFKRGGPPRLLLLDTERMSLGTPTQTWFRGPTSSSRWTCISEAGGYKPSPQDTLTAPFYPDPSQRIFALSLKPQRTLRVIKVETFLRLARERAGREVQWREWKSHLVETLLKRELDRSQEVQPWISGFRLFHVSTVPDDIIRSCDLHVYDFSGQGRMKSLQPTDNGHQVMHPSVTGHRLPWKVVDMDNVSFGHDSLVFQVYTSILGTEPAGTLLHIQSL